MTLHGLFVETVNVVDGVNGTQEKNEEALRTSTPVRRRVRCIFHYKCISSRLYDVNAGLRSFTLVWRV